MLILVQIDLSQANLTLFDEYEAQVLLLLESHRAKLVERLRSIDGQSEFHLLEFSDIAAFDDFRADPVRISLQDLWQSCGATSVLTEVFRHPGREPASIAPQA